MAQLDAEEQAARGAVEPDRLSAAEVVAYLRSLPSLWTDSGPDGRQVLATALFARTDVTGFERLEYELTPDAIELGLGAALPAVFEIGQKRGFGRGERSSPAEPTSSPRVPRAFKKAGADTIPTSGSGVGSSAEALELAPQTLAGPALPTHGQDLRPGVRHDRRAMVHVTGRGDEGSDTRLDRPHDLDDALAIRDEGLDPIAWANLC